jgi:hypothetical protein
MSFSIGTTFGSTDGIEGGLTSKRGRGHAFGEAGAEAASIVGSSPRGGGAPGIV